jgi:hypothetical protein
MDCMFQILSPLDGQWPPTNHRIWHRWRPFRQDQCAVFCSFLDSFLPMLAASFDGWSAPWILPTFEAHVIPGRPSMIGRQVQFVV